VTPFKASPARSNTRAPRDRQSGQGMVELALLMPFLVLLLAGIVDLGRGIRALTLLTNAASQGAQYATFNPTDTAGIRTRVTNALEGSGITIADPNASIYITFPSGTAAGQPIAGQPNAGQPSAGQPSAGQPIRVQVEYQLTTILGMILGFDAIPIRGANQAISF
jgi:Flp pilus assembly protein TadG